MSADRNPAPLVYALTVGEEHCVPYRGSFLSLLLSHAYVSSQIKVRALWAMRNERCCDGVMAQDKRPRADGTVPSFRSDRKTTVGVEFATMVVTHPNGKRIKAQIWDTGEGSTCAYVTHECVSRIKNSSSLGFTTDSLQIQTKLSPHARKSFRWSSSSSQLSFTSLIPIHTCLLVREIRFMLSSPIDEIGCEENNARPTHR